MTLSFSVVGQAEFWKGHFIVALELNASCPNLSFSIKRDQPGLPGNPSDIADTNNYAGSDSLAEDKRQREDGYGVQMFLNELISWQWLHATNLLIAYELTLSTRDVPLSYPPFTRLPVDVVVAIGWLLKSYWTPNSLLLNTIERQSAVILKKRYQPFSITTVMAGCEHDQQKGQSSESSVQQTPATHICPPGHFTSILFSSSEEGNGDPQQYQHTLDLDCFVYPCNGICKFRPSSESGMLDFLNSWTDDTELTYGQSSYLQLANRPSYGCLSHSQTESTGHHQQNSLLEALNNPPAIQLQYTSGQLIRTHDTDGNRPYNRSSFDGVALDGVALDGVALDGVALDGVALDGVALDGVAFDGVTLDGVALDGAALDGLAPVSMGVRTATALVKQEACNEIGTMNNDQHWRYGMVSESSKAMTEHKKAAHSGQQTCAVTTVGKDGQQQPCGRLFKNVRSLSSHKSKCHGGQKTCDMTVVGEGGQEKSCGTVCRNPEALRTHKRIAHTGQQTCIVIVVGEDGQPRPCGTVCKNKESLISHKSKIHSGQQTCAATVVAEGGQRRPCGKICENAKSLYTHRSLCHSGQQTCVLTVVGEDRQERQCGKVCKNAIALLNHKRSKHARQQTCGVILVSMDGQRRPCGKVCRNPGALQNHKRIAHTGQQTCNLTVVGRDGQTGQCGGVFKNLQSLKSHKLRIHSGQRTCDEPVVREDGQQRPCGKACKNNAALMYHKGIHRKRKPVNVNQTGDLSATESKKKK
ncbi:hypothetical protein [Endozoicomonas sp. ALC020]|uniref:hypothetical protein n=1 Tax=unclassified Endozoicomonas TaxID=2644528 RepID=UPI003BB10810